MTLSRLRNDAMSIFNAGLKAVDPYVAIKKALKIRENILEIEGKRYDLPNFENIYVIGMGKASAYMAQALEELLGEKIKAGIVNVKYKHTQPLKFIKANEAGHPIPDEAGLKGTKEIIQLLQQTGEKDLVFCLISGGGSALLPCPAEGIALDDKQQLTKALMGCGATIHEINTLRKKISQVKGGRLAKLVYPSALVSLILSDVIGDRLDSIASGPTVPDITTFSDCKNILEKYSIQNIVPASIIDFLDKGISGEVEDTPKAGGPIFKRTQNVIIGSNIQALEAAKKKAADLGYSTVILSSSIEGETTEAAKFHAAIAKEIICTNNPVTKPACVISGGETTVKVKGKGLGGRNQEFALAAALEIDGLNSTLIMSCGTDGTDGPTDAAGAIVDGTTIKRSTKLGLDAKYYVRENDSYN
ncbi:MAG: glycerate kinase type-2 family protein, partial [Thermodesulfobacteriota bacterium]